MFTSITLKGTKTLVLSVRKNVRTVNFPLFSTKDSKISLQIGTMKLNSKFTSRNSSK